MTLTQRLTRAGATFIVFGIAAAFVPTNSNAFSATDDCVIPAQKDYVGNSSDDKTATYTLPSSNILILTAYPANGVKVTGVSPAGTGYTNILIDPTVTNPRVSTTRIGTGTGTDSESVTVTFSDGHTVTYTVTYTAS